MEWNSGDVAVGQWPTNQQHKPGTYISPDEDTYSGRFEHGLRTVGVSIASDGSRYEGSWRGNKRCGPGVSYSADGRVQESGDWLDDDCVNSLPIHAVARSAEVSEATRQAATAKADVCEVAEAFAKLESLMPVLTADRKLVALAAGSYEGELRGGEPHGFGVFKFRNGDNYTGLWEAGEMRGLGQYRYNGGVTCTAIFKHDVADGLGELQFPDGRTYRGEQLGCTAHGYGVTTWRKPNQSWHK